MVLEATMVCLDNSEFSRNGDFGPTRLEAQRDAAMLYCGMRVNNNPENSVGLLPLGANRGAIHPPLAPTSERERFNAAVANVPIDGENVKFVQGIKTALLALKHRLNRNQRQRILAFVCSPVSATESEMEALGKMLKKNNVAIDIVSFGEVEINNALLQKLWRTVNSNNTSNLVEVNESSVPLSQSILRAPLVPSDGAPPGAGMAGGMDEFGIDPSEDPDLYMALRISLEEERARQVREGGGGGTSDMRTGDAHQMPQTTADGPAATGETRTLNDGDSAQLTQQEPPSFGGAGGGPDDRPPSVEQIMAMDIADDLRQALLMSLEIYEDSQSRRDSEPAGLQPQETGSEAAQTTDRADQFHTPASAEDEEISSEVLEELAEAVQDVEFDDPEVRAALLRISKKKEKSKKEHDRETQE